MTDGSTTANTANVTSTTTHTPDKKYLAFDLQRDDYDRGKATREVLTRIAQLIVDKAAQDLKKAQNALKKASAADKKARQADVNTAATAKATADKALQNAKTATPSKTDYRWAKENNPTYTANVESAADNKNSVATVKIPEPVMELQKDLKKLGFLIVGAPNGVFTRETEWAVREFQIYAKMEQVARVKTDLQETALDKIVVPKDQENDISPYVYSLERVTNGKKYTGKVSGVVNQQTRDAIEYWLLNHYRCPVVAEVWSSKIDPKTKKTTYHLSKSNVWLAKELANKEKVYIRDFTSYYEYPSTRSATKRQLLATRTTSMWGGFVTWQEDSWQADSKILPQTLIPNVTAVSNLTGTQIDSARTSTYRVVGAISEVEPLKHFDCLNTYDNALLSFGICHWTLGLGSNSKYDIGEAGAFLAYLKTKYATAYDKAIGFFGIQPNETWIKLNTGSEFSFACWLQWQTETDYADIDNSLVSKVGDASWLQSIHWYFRFSMAGRTIKDFRYAMWDMSRIRLKGIYKFKRKITKLNGHETALGDIFTSEKAMAILLRWHIHRPSHLTLLENKYLDEVVTEAFAVTTYNKATVTWGTDSSKWTDTHEAILFEKLLAKAKDKDPNAGDTFDTVSTWPHIGTKQEDTDHKDLGALKAARNSFKFYSDGL